MPLPKQLLAVSSDAIAQTTTLETVRVTGMRISSTTLCEGDGCRDFFNAPEIAQLPGYYDELSDVGLTEPDRPECSGGMRILAKVQYG